MQEIITLEVGRSVGICVHAPIGHYFPERSADWWSSRRLAWLKLKCGEKSSGLPWIAEAQVISYQRWPRWLEARHDIRGDSYVALLYNRSF